MACRGKVVALLAALLWVPACDMAEPAESDGAGMPAASAYFDHRMEFPPRPHAIYPFISEVPPWLGPNLVLDDVLNVTYDGFPGRGGFQRYLLCRAALDGRTVIAALPDLAGKDVGLLNDGALGYAFHAEAAVGAGGTVTGRALSLLNLALTRSVHTTLENVSAGAFSSRLASVSDLSIPPATLDVALLERPDFLTVTPLPRPMAQQLAQVAASLRPDGILAVVQQEQVEDFVWHQGDVVPGLGISQQHAHLDGAGMVLIDQRALPDQVSTVYLYAAAGATLEDLGPSKTSRPEPTWVARTTQVLCEGYGAGMEDEERRKPAEPYRLQYFRPGGLEESLAHLPPLEGLHVADIGAGFGFFAFPLARMVGSRGRVYAVDIDPVAIETMRLRLELNPGLAPPGVLHLHMGLQENPLLPEDSVDLAVAFQVVHLFGPSPPTDSWATLASFLTNLRQAIRPGGHFIAVLPQRPFAMTHLDTALELYRSHGFELSAQTTIPFHPPETVTGVAIWATCFDESVTSTVYDFVVND
jgi:SAM-dependent methyltransferase